MAEVVPFARRKSHREAIPLIEKVVDGEIIEYIDVDALSPSERRRFFEKGRLAETCSASR
jgi:hypothetical protein